MAGVRFWRNGLGEVGHNPIEAANEMMKEAMKSCPQ